MRFPKPVRNLVTTMFCGALLVGLTPVLVAEEGVAAPNPALLDPILAAYIEKDCSAREIVALGHDEAIVRRVIEMVDRNEYKRRQASNSQYQRPKTQGCYPTLPTRYSQNG